jgi:hypothetical protein
MREVVERPEQVAELSTRILAARDTIIKLMSRHADEVDGVYREVILGPGG